MDKAALRIQPVVILLSFLYLVGAVISIGLGRKGITEIFFLLPFILGGIYLVAFQHTRTWYLTFLLLPLSLNFTNLESGMGLSLPGEPLLAGLLGVLLLRIILVPTLDKRFITHPVSLFIFAELAWIAITTMTSSMPFVSFKYTVMRAVFVGVFFLGTSVLFQNVASRVRYFLFFGIGMALASLYVLGNYSMYGFQIRYHVVVAQPFFSDHTIFGACVAMIFPFWIFLTLHPEIFGISKKHKKWLIVVLTLLFLGLFFSFSRAAWLSIVLAAGLYVWISLKIRFRWLMLLVFGAGMVLFIYKKDIFKTASSNKATSNEDLTEHVQSVTNVSTDDSNKERLNRWNSALRMFRERPVTGWGPGTYQFVYGPFQSIHEMTRISTKKGDRGGTHSEYLRSLSESGVFGMIFYLLVLLAVLFRGMRFIYQATDLSEKYLAMGALLGLVTYIFHGGVNNFLETDKFAGLFFGLCSLVVYLDVNGKRKKYEEKLDF
ncbi:MAG: O-antigen ligase family protein [Bacteroidia bacterium]|nr:O-antigen ligase family protein [Bacteroidia bacterium]